MLLPGPSRMGSPGASSTGATRLGVDPFVDRARSLPDDGTGMRQIEHEAHGHHGGLDEAAPAVEAPCSIVACVGQQRDPTAAEAHGVVGGCGEEPAPDPIAAC